MNTNRSAALALAAGSVAGLVTMATHPTGHTIVVNASGATPNTLNAAVHTLAIIAQPVILAGALAIVGRLRARRDLAVGGYVFLAIAGIAVIIAAAASGYMTLASLDGYATADEAGRRAMLDALRYTSVVNQAFASVHVTLSSIAILLWSIAILRGRELDRGLGILGLIVAPALLAGLASGVLHLDIHGFGLGVLTQAAWLMWAARCLWREQP
jgi:hypothetical protein